jgi:hypothetical protein
MSKIFINGVALPNSEYNIAESRWTRGYGGKIEGSTVGDRHQLSITTDTDRISVTNYTQDQLDDINSSDAFQILPIWIGGISQNPVQLRLINPNAIVRPVVRYSLYRTITGTSMTPLNSTLITTLKRNTSNSRAQKAIVLLQGAGGSGGTAPTGFATRDAAGGGSGATQLVLIDLFAVNSSSFIQVGAPGIASTGTTSANGVAGATAVLDVFSSSSSTPRNIYSSSGGGGGSSDVPTTPVGGTAGTATQTYSPFPFGTVLYQANGAVGGGTGTGGGIGSLNTTTGISGEFFGTYINTTDTANNKNRFIDFTSVGELGTVTLTGSTSKSGGTRPSGGGAGGAASRFGRGGNGKATTTGALNDGLYGSGGGGGNGGVASPNNRGGTGGGGFVVLFF